MKRLKMKKRFLSTLLTICMMLTLMPVFSLPAVAADYNYTLFLHTDGELYENDEHGAIVNLTGADVDVSGTTLTLTDFNFTTSADVALSVPGGTTIVLAGNTGNVLASECTISVNTGVYVRDAGDLTINGTGSLDVTCSDVASGDSYGILVTDGGMAIEGSVTTNITSGDALGNMSLGIFMPGTSKNITIKDNVIVNATGGTADNSGGIATNCDIEISGNAQVTAAGGTADNSGGILADDVEISGNAQVTAVADSASVDGYGIYTATPLTISGGTVTAIGDTCAINPDYTVPNGYKYWVNTSTTDPGGAGIVSDGSFDIDSTHKFAKIKVPSSAKDITDFTIPGQVGSSSIVGTAIEVTVPYGTDVTSLTPTITVSAGATVSPTSGTAANFTSQVTYTVTAEDGSTKVYTVTVTVAAVATPVISINTQPAASTIVTHGSISGNLLVAASVTEGATLSYQWYDNITASTTGGNVIAGETSANFTIPTALNVGEYYYYCVVSATGGAISVTSDLATVTVGATPITTYAVTVNNGTGSGNYAENTTVNISANAAPSGQVFDKWTVDSGGVTLANANSASTSFTMPAGAVEITASYTTTSKPTPTVVDLTYGIPNDRVYNGTAQALTVGAPNGMGAVTVKYNGSASVPVNADTYAITVDIAEGSSYAAASDLALGNYIIAPKTLTLIADNQVIEVGASGPIYTYTINGLVSGDSASAIITTPPTLSVTGFTSSSIPGQYAIAISGASTSSSNYTLAYRNGTLTVTDKIIINISGITVASKTYDGTAISPSGTLTVTGSSGAIIDYAPLEYSYTNLQTGTTSSTPPQNAGNYTLIIKTAAGDTKYFGESTILSFSIDKSSITISADNKTAYVGDTAPVYTYTTTGLAGGILSVLPTLSCNPDMTKAGSYTITPSGAAVPNTDNYYSTISYITGTLTVNSRSSGGGGGGGGGNSISPTTARFNPNSPQDITITINFSGNSTFTQLLSGTTVLEAGKDYTRSGNKITINKEYLATLASGSHILTFDLSSGTDPKLTITVGEGGTDTGTDTDTGTGTGTDTGTTGGWNNPFSDVRTSDWFYNNVAYVVDQGLFTGTSASEFSPNQPMTRGMLVTVLGRMSAVNPSEYSGASFSDVTQGQYYAPYVKWASEKGIVTGVGNNRFAPNTNISRQDLAVILYRYAQVMEISLPSTVSPNTFTDNAKISSYASQAVSAIQQTGVITGKPGNLFDPQGNATRSEVAAMLHRFCEMNQ